MKAKDYNPSSYFGTMYSPRGSDDNSGSDLRQVYDGGITFNNNRSALNQSNFKIDDVPRFLNNPSGL